MRRGRRLLRRSGALPGRRSRRPPRAHSVLRGAVPCKLTCVDARVACARSASTTPRSASSGGWIPRAIWRTDSSTDWCWIYFGLTTFRKGHYWL